MIAQALIELEEINYNRVCHVIEWLYHHLMYTREPSWSRYLEDHGGFVS